MIEGSPLKLKATNNCLNVCEWVEMVKRNKDFSLPSHTVLESAKEKNLNYSEMFASYGSIYVSSYSPVI